MSWRGFILAILLAPLACTSHHDGNDLFDSEIAFLSEDVVDLMTNVFQTGENAFEGEGALAIDITDPAGPGNNFTVTYDLPEEDREGLGLGSGRVRLQVTEETVPNTDPFFFSFETTNALEVVMVYDLIYDGDTAFGRFTEVTLTATLTATRASAVSPFVVRYDIDGVVNLGATFTDIGTTFFSPGSPRDGVTGDGVTGDGVTGDGGGLVDDPEVDAGVLDYNLDYGDSSFHVEGDVGNCCTFRERFFYDEVL